MGGQGNCVDGKLDDSGYSSPVPLIGLYITGATLVCLLFILVDAFAGFRNRKRWLPCRLFSLNSITLTLLSIAVKLPLDLTSSMPRIQDQLSKLTSTTLICICMGIFMPSLGTCRESESFNNMAALSIFVVTIAVNVCIQMYTGVIILYRAEHIIILFCMMILLVALWYFASEIHSQNEVSHDGIKDIFMKGKGSMLHRLKVSYLRGYDSNPQFMLWRRPLSILVATLCIISSVVLMRVSFRYLVSKTSDGCEGVSVYKWLMASIVVSQITTILVGGLAITFRFFSLFGHTVGEFGMLKGVEDAEAIIAYNPIFRRTSFFYLKFYARKVVEIFVITISLFPSLPFAFLEGAGAKLSESWHNSNTEKEVAMEELKNLIHDEGEMDLDKWTLRKGVNDMKKWIEKANTSNQLIKLLSKTPPFHQHDSPFRRLKAYYDSRKSGYLVSSLSVVLLVRVATISIPHFLSGSLSSILNEVFKVLQFVDKKMSASSFENKKKYVLAEALHESDNFNSLLPDIVRKSGYHDGDFRNQPQLIQSIAIVKGVKTVLHRVLTDFIQQQDFESIGEFYGYMEQLFVDMLNEFLVQLPNAIFREIIESNGEDCEKTIKFALKVVCKMEQLEAIVQWSFPVGTTITQLTSDVHELPFVW
ncbi:hypothetical protein Sjap_009259 [Stephania japonica]|uniref:Uncharacterized protein n=1 Tax=Stephania japonica TaxID=461633 RepID=A0AAP0JS06_9MAGN